MSLRCLVIRFVFVALLTITVQQSFAGILYGLGGRNVAQISTPVSLYSVDVNTGRETLVGATGRALRGFTIDHITGRAFASDRNSGGLYEIDLATGQTSFVGSSSGRQFREMAFTASGELVGYTSRRQGFYDFYRIDTSTGQATLLNPNTNMGSLWSFSYSIADDELVYLDSYGLGVVNEINGRMTRTVTRNRFFYRPFSAIDENGNIFHVDRRFNNDASLYRLDRATTSSIRVGARTNIEFVGLAFNNAPPSSPGSGMVPEPTSLTMWVTGLLGLAITRRRRK